MSAPMKKFNPFECIFEAKDWEKEEAEAWGTEDPQQMRVENPCYICDKHVDPKTGSYAEDPTSGEKTYVHDDCISREARDERSELEKDVDERIEMSGSSFYHEKASKAVYALATRRGIKFRHREFDFYREQYNKTNDIAWIDVLMSWLPQNRGIFEDHIRTASDPDRAYSEPAGNPSETLYRVSGGTLKGLRKYAEVANTLSKIYSQVLATSNIRAEFGARKKFYFGLEPELYYLIPKLWSKQKAGNKTNFPEVLMTLLTISGTYDYNYGTSRYQSVYTPTVEDFQKFSSTMSNFTASEIMEPMQGCVLRILKSLKAGVDPHAFMVPMALKIDKYLIGGILRTTSDNDNFGNLMAQLWTQHISSLRKLVANSTQSGYCSVCDQHINDYYCATCDQAALGKNDLLRRMMEEVSISQQFPEKNDLKDLKSVAHWIKRTKEVHRKAVFKKNDRRAQRNHRWAVAKYPKEYFRGLRLAPLYAEVIQELKKRIEQDPELILAIHGRDGEMIYELAKIVDPALFKRMVYFITSRPLTSQRAVGPSDEAVVKHNEYITRILPKDKKALHVDTGFGGSIPDWFRSNGWNVSGVGLISAEKQDYALLDRSYHDHGLRKIVLDDLEHTPQRLAKIENIKEWGNLTYSKHAVGFWARLYGIIVGYMSGDRDSDRGPSGRDVSHNHRNKKRKKECWGCKAPKLLKSAHKHLEKRTYSSMGEFAKAQAAQQADTDEHWED
jgi:hypothetical protein